MKKLIISILLIAIVVLACFKLYESMLGPVAIDENIDYSEYEKLYYYNKLNEEQKELYIKLDISIDNLDRKIHLGFINNENVKSDIDKVLRAITNDKPEYYFLPNEYKVKTIELLFIKYIYIEIDYSVKNEYERERKDKQMYSVVQDILYKTVNDSMTDIEKQIAIHDELMERVTYYEYQDINEIPNEKHNAYEVLVNKEGVCDGISKALSILYNEVGIETIIVIGKSNGIAHAWNIVKLDGEYYHLDATSNAIDINNVKYVVHNYFNLTDEEISKTHIISNEYSVPKCNGTKYNYYEYNGYTIKYEESMKHKLMKIMEKQSGNSVLELKMDKLYSLQNLLETLYFLDFNNWYTDGKTSVSYHSSENIYIFENKNKR